MIKTDTNAPVIVSTMAKLVQNTFTPSGQGAFMATVPSALQPIYITAQRWFQWSVMGWVPELHNTATAIPQTSIGVTVTDKIAQTLGGNAVLNTNNDVMREWYQAENLTTAFDAAIAYAVKMGTSLVKLNKEDGVVYPEVFRLDTFTATADRHGKVTEAKVFLDYMESGLGYRKCGYWLVEHRYYDKKVGKVRYFVSKSQIKDSTAGKGNFISYANCPAEVKEWLDFRDIKIDTPVDCDFNDTLGLFLLKVRNLGINSTTAYGESFIEPIKSDLCTYEYNEANKLVDMYTGRSRVMVPQQQANNGYGPVSGLDNFMLLSVPDDSMDKSKPEAMQFEYRTDEHRVAKETILESIASKIGISATSIGSNLKGNNAKTATEVSSETDMTASFAASIRRNFIVPFIEKVLQASYPGVDFTVVFPTSGFTGSAVRKDQATSLYQAGLVTVAQALRILNPDMADEDIEKMAGEVKAEKKEDNQGWLDNDDEL